jgi:hypothetical protein
MSLEQILNSKRKWIIINTHEVVNIDKIPYDTILKLSDYTYKTVLNTSKYHFHNLIAEAMLHTFKMGVAIDSEIEKIFVNHQLYNLLNCSDNYLDWFINVVIKHYDYLYMQMEDNLKLNNFKVSKIVNGWDLNTYGLLVEYDGVKNNDDNSNTN